MSPSIRIALAVAAKAPIPGRVKTRLVPPLTSQEACRLYAAFLRDLLRKAGAVPGVTPAVLYTPATPEGRRALAPFLHPGLLVVPQRGKELGERLSAGFRHLFAAGFQAAVIVGADHPTLPAARLKDAVRRLEHGHPAVLGPTRDGGYYLVGLRSDTRGLGLLFENIPWSTAGVLDATLARARAAGVRPAMLPRWDDVDSPDDLERLRRDCRKRAIAAEAPDTARVLAAL